MVYTVEVIPLCYTVIPPYRHTNIPINLSWVDLNDTRRDIVITMTARLYIILDDSIYIFFKFVCNKKFVSQIFRGRYGRILFSPQSTKFLFKNGKKLKNTNIGQQKLLATNGAKIRPKMTLNLN